MTTTALLERMRAQGRDLGLGIEILESSAGTDLPTTIQIIPAGKIVEARDRRRFRVDRDEIIKRAHANGADLQIDLDHSGFAGSIFGHVPSPAAGWIDHKSIRRESSAKDAAIVGDVQRWTSLGAEQLRERLYRYLSPAIAVEPPTDDELADGLPGTAVEVLNASLVNMPALKMPALAASRGPTVGAPARQPAGTRPGLAAERPSLFERVEVQDQRAELDHSDAGLLEELGLDCTPSFEERTARANLAHRIARAGGGEARAVDRLALALRDRQVLMRVRSELRTRAQVARTSAAQYARANTGWVATRVAAAAGLLGGNR